MRSLSAALALTLFMSMSAGAETVQQSTLNPVKAEAAKQYPRIVLFSTSWCPHCRAAKEYMTKNNIPFINRDVEVDDAAMEDLTKKYKSAGVPVIVFGKEVPITELAKTINTIPYEILTGIGDRVKRVFFKE